MAKLILFFIDGIGLAPPSDSNPVGNLFKDETDGFGLQETGEPLLFSHSTLCPLDACLGVEGVPQSATGQTTLFTGVNAPELLGYHLTAFPNEKLMACFHERSIMKVLNERNIRVTAANLYSKEFFEDRDASDRNRYPASTLTIKASGVPLRMLKDYNEGRAVFADITNELIRDRGYNVEVIEPELAGRRTLGLLEDHDFVFFEYFLTDRYGHKRDREKMNRCIEVLNRYVRFISQGLKGNEALLIVSDHGNAESAETASHTLNPVPGLLIGGTQETRESFSSSRTILDIYPFMLDYFKSGT
jgi:2,3-bisphosphoglycerate-independent phosphoglycerate mutase